MDDSTRSQKKNSTAHARPGSPHADEEAKPWNVVVGCDDHDNQLV